jgi:hypothetical protein
MSTPRHWRSPHCGGARRQDEVRAGELGENLLQLDGKHPALVRLPPALVGPPDSGLVLAEEGEIFVGEDRVRRLLLQEAHDAMAGAGVEVLKQDEDVLDTWFSSALWPFSTQGWPDKRRI